MTEPGDSAPAVECKAALMLGARRGRLLAEALVRNLYSELIDCCDPERRTWPRSVRIWRPFIITDGSLVAVEVDVDVFLSRRPRCE